MVFLETSRPAIDFRSPPLDRCQFAFSLRIVSIFVDRGAVPHLAESISNWSPFVLSLPQSALLVSLPLRESIEWQACPVQTACAMAATSSLSHGGSWQREGRDGAPACLLCRCLPIFFVVCVVLSVLVGIVVIWSLQNAWLQAQAFAVGRSDGSLASKIWERPKARNIVRR